MSEQNQAGDGFDEFFQGSGGEYAPSLKFTMQSGPRGETQVGGGVIGTVVAMAMMDQTKIGTDEKILDKKGKVKQQLQIILQTDLRNWDKVAKVPTDDDGNALAASEDDGKRAIYAKGWMPGAIADAVEKATGKRGGPRVGGRLGVKVIELVPTDNGNPYAKYSAVYEAPTGTEAFFEQAGPTEQAPAAQPAQQAPALSPAPAPVSEQPPF